MLLTQKTKKKSIIMDIEPKNRMFFYSFKLTSIWRVVDQNWVCLHNTVALAAAE